MFTSFNARAVGLPDLDLETTLRVAAAAGFDAVDLMVRDLVHSGVDLIGGRRRMDDLGLRAGAFPMTMDWRGAGDAFRRGLDDLRRLAGAARELGLTRTGTWVLPETPTPPASADDPAGHRQRVATWHIDRLGAIARVLAVEGIRLGLEVIGVASFRRGHGVPFVTRLADLDPALSPLRSEANVGLLVDAFHLHAAGEPPSTALIWGADRLVWAHVADLPPGPAIPRAAILDAERGLPDPHGPVSCRAFLATLDHAGFDGPVTAEPLARCAALLDRSPATVACSVRDALSACWPVQRNASAGNAPT